MDAVALPLPTFIGVNLEPILSLPISMSWVGNTGASSFPRAVVINWTRLLSIVLINDSS